MQRCPQLWLGFSTHKEVSFMQLRCEKPSWAHSCTINAHDVPCEWNSGTAGLGVPPSMSYTPFCIVMLGCHVPTSAIFVAAWEMLSEGSCSCCSSTSILLVACCGMGLGAHVCTIPAQGSKNHKNFTSAHRALLDVVVTVLRLTATPRLSHPT